MAEMAQGMFGQAKGSVQSGNPLAIGGLAALAGALLGGGGGATRGAIGGGALALLGTLAMQALRGRQQQSTPTDATALAREAPLGLREPQNASEEQELEQRALLIVRAMINAAKADGQIDPQEVERISAKLGEAGSDQEARAFLAQEMQTPIDSDAITRQATSPELAVQVYAASLLAIEVDTAAERAYLRDLAARLVRRQRSGPCPPGVGSRCARLIGRCDGRTRDGSIRVGRSRRCLTWLVFGLLTVSIVHLRLAVKHPARI